MKKIPHKVRLGIGIALLIWSLLAFLAVIIYASYKADLWILISVPILAFITFIIGIIFIPKNDESGSPIVSDKKYQIKKRKITKNKNIKARQEDVDEDEEDDEMIFIEEMMDDE